MEIYDFIYLIVILIIMGIFNYIFYKLGECSGFNKANSKKRDDIKYGLGDYYDI